MFGVYIWCQAIQQRRRRQQRRQHPQELLLEVLVRLLVDPVLLLNLVCPSLNPNPISKANPNSASNADHDDFHPCILRDSVSGDTTTTSTATTATTTPATTTTPAETSAGGIYALMFWWPWTCWLISYHHNNRFIAIDCGLST